MKLKVEAANEIETTRRLQQIVLPLSRGNRDQHKVEYYSCTLYKIMTDLTMADER